MTKHNVVCPLCGSPLERWYDTKRVAEYDPETGVLGPKRKWESTFIDICSNTACGRQIYAHELRDMRRKAKEGVRRDQGPGYHQG